MTTRFECLRCGRCCLAAGEILHVSQCDVNRWEKENRIDILDKLWLNSFLCEHCGISWPAWQGENCPKCGKHSDRGDYYWLDQRRPKDFFSQQMASPRCPFLKKTRGKDEYSCLIHDTKPEICRDFPQLDENEVTENEEECIEWGCKGYSKWKKKREAVANMSIDNWKRLLELLKKREKPEGVAQLLEEACLRKHLRMTFACSLSATSNEWINSSLV